MCYCVIMKLTFQEQDVPIILTQRAFSVWINFLTDEVKTGFRSGVQILDPRLFV